MSENSDTRVLVIGDAHVDEHQSLDRFKHLGNLIEVEQPSHIIIMGDFLSMHCFSAWDRDKRLKMEGVRRCSEIAAGNEALDLMLSGIDRINKTRKKSKKPLYKPELVYLEGNHEEREIRYIEYNPELLGTLSYVKDLRLAERGFKHFAYRDYYYINEIGFTHIPMNKANKPIQGASIMQNALSLHAHSIVFGHTHELRIQGEHRHGAPHYNQALNVGCFFEHVDDYAKGSKTDYWRGVLMLNVYSPNRFDVETISIGHLKKRYK